MLKCVLFGTNVSVFFWIESNDSNRNEIQLLRGRGKTRVWNERDIPPANPYFHANQGITGMIFNEEVFFPRPELRFLQVDISTF